MRTMRELIRTNDAVLISWLDASLTAAGIAHVVLDGHTSILEGSIGAIPRRVMVHEADLARARTLLEEGQALARAQDPEQDLP